MLQRSCHHRASLSMDRVHVSQTVGVSGVREASGACASLCGTLVVYSSCVCRTLCVVRVHGCKSGCAAIVCVNCCVHLFHCECPALPDNACGVQHCRNALTRCIALSTHGIRRAVLWSHGTHTSARDHESRADAKTLMVELARTHRHSSATDSVRHH